jgi:hypothetical protein
VGQVQEKQVGHALGETGLTLDIVDRYRKYRQDRHAKDRQDRYREERKDRCKK